MSREPAQNLPEGQEPDPTDPALFDDLDADTGTDDQVDP